MGDTRRIVAETCPITGLRKVRMSAQLKVQSGNLNGVPAFKDRRFYLDGTEARTLTTRQDVPGQGEVVEKRTESIMAWEAVPARTNDVLDFGRLEQAAKALTGQMMEFGPDNPPSPEQVVAFAQSWQHLQTWRKEAEARFTAADGQIGTVGTLLRQFL